MHSGSESDVDRARVSAGHSDGETLFPVSDYGRPQPTPRGLCEQIGLNWMMAGRLHEDGWISFAPNDVERLDRAREAELRLVGSLVAAGCDAAMLKQLLASLHKPYAYRLDRMCYNWDERCWEMRPDVDDLLHDAERCIDRLSEEARTTQLERLRSRIEYYLRESQRTRPW